MMRDSIQIRPAQPGDAEVAAALLYSAYMHTPVTSPLREEDESGLIERLQHFFRDGMTAKSLAEGKTDFFLQQVQSGLNVTSDLVFDAPASDTGLKLQVQGSLFSNGQTIDLGK